MRATFITLAIEDGADPEILEDRVTRARQSRSAFDGYNRGPQWERTCAEWRSCGSRAARRGCFGRRRVGFASARCSVCKL
jgi:hypothetical protein